VSPILSQNPVESLTGSLSLTQTLKNAAAQVVVIFACRRLVFPILQPSLRSGVFSDRDSVLGPE